MSSLGRTEQSRAIRLFLLDAIRHGNSGFIQDAVSQFSVSRQTVHKHLSFLTANQYLIAHGSTRARTYELGPVRINTGHYTLQGLQEHEVYRDDFAFVFNGLTDNVNEICHYGFTEMLNNAIDHSNGQSVLIRASAEKDRITILVTDDGEGIFRKIARELNLGDPRESLLELSKGKLTTDPEHHTGEGIFFSSRAFDMFHIFSGDLDFTHNDQEPDDYLLHLDDDFEGTTVYMEINRKSSRSLGEVFDQYSSGPDEYRFNQTVVPVRMALYEGERLISRSQAKRIMNRVERFENVVLDFEGINSIGQAFADEVFRVFQARYPNIHITAVNASKEVQMMIKRALAGS